MIPRGRWEANIIMGFEEIECKRAVEHDAGDSE
jgi:hypothetical protein